MREFPAAAAGLGVKERSSVSKQELKWNGAGGLGKKCFPANGPAGTTLVPGTVIGMNALIQKLMLDGNAGGVGLGGVGEGGTGPGGTGPGGTVPEVQVPEVQ